jgi:hypothetical protein
MANIPLFTIYLFKLNADYICVFLFFWNEEVHFL